MATTARLSLVTLGVSDLSRATAFYTTLGFPRSSVSVDGDVTFFRMAGSVLALYPRERLAEDAGVEAQGSGFRGVALAMNCDSEDGVDQAFEQWASAGASIMKLPAHAVWGGYTGYVADLDGHLWELAFNPGFTFTPDGLVDLPA
jgi:predicted lactoylglutathione lyase